MERVNFRKINKQYNRAMVIKSVEAEYLHSNIPSVGLRQGGG